MTGDGSRGKQVRAVLFAAIMVVSMVAMGASVFVGSAGATASSINITDEPGDAPVGQTAVNQTVTFDVGIDSNGSSASLTLTGDTSTITAASAEVSGDDVSLESGPSVGGSGDVSLTVSDEGSNDQADTATVTLNLTHNTAGVSSNSGLSYTIDDDDSGTSASTSTFDLVSASSIIVSNTNNNDIPYAVNNVVTDGTGTVTIEGGDYTLSQTLTVSDPMTIEAAESANPTISYSASDATDAIVINSPGVTLDGLTVERTSAANDQPAQAVSVRSAAGGDTVEIINSVVSGDSSANAEDDQNFGIYVAESNGNVDDVELRNNTVSNFSSGVLVTAGDGNTLENVTVDGNTLEDNAYGVAVSQFGSATGPQEVTIQNNQIENNDQAGIRIPGSGDTLFTFSKNDLDLSTITVTDNDIEQNGGYGLNASGTNTLNATSNWWGSENGPREGANTYEDGNQGATVSDNVEFTPWLDNSTDNGGVEFAPVTNESDVGFASIQAAVDSTDDTANTIQVRNGTYSESVVIKTNDTTLQGVEDANGNSPTIVGEGVNEGSQPHAAIHVNDGSGPVQNVTVEGFTVRNPDGKFGIFAGTGTTNSNSDGIGGLVIQNNTVENVSTASSGGSLTGGPAGIGIRGDYGTSGNPGIDIRDNEVDTVETDGYTNAVGITLKSFTGDAGFGKDSSGSDVNDPSSPPATDTDIVGNDISNIDGGNNSRTKGISVGGEFENVVVDNNTISDVTAAPDGSAGNAFGVTFTENSKSYSGNQYDIDNDGNGERIGPRDFEIKNNEFDQITAGSPASIFIGGYEDLNGEDVNAVKSNDILDTGAGVERFDGDQDGFQPGDEDTLNATSNWWGSPNGPDASSNTYNDGNQGAGAEDVKFTPWLDNSTDNGGTEFAPVTNGSDDGFSNIQAAIDASSDETIDLAAGTFEEEVTVDSGVTLNGTGSSSDGTVLNGTSSGNGVTVDASDVSVEDIRITDYGNGIRLKGANSNIEFENVYSVQNNNRGMEVRNNVDVQNLLLDSVSFSNNSGDGLRAATESSIDGLRIQDSHFDDNLGADQSGIEIYQSEGSPGQLNDVVIEDTTFNNNGQKGIYTEKLSNATFDNITVDGVQNDTSNTNTGIDINLKYDDYQNISIQNSVVANVSEGDPYKNNPSFATGIAVKARDDPSSYNSTPATLDDVTIDNVTVEDSFNGLRFGEPGVDYSGSPAGPTGVTVSDSTFEDNEGYHVEDVSNSVDLDTVESNNDFDRTVTSSVGIYSSIQSAVDAADEAVASTDETIEVPSGTYNESVTVDQANITIESAGDLGEPTINASGIGPAVNITAQNVTVSGFTLETDSGDGVTVGDVDADAGDGIDIVGNNIVDVSGDGVSADDDGTGLVDAGENWWGSENGPNAENGSNATNVATAPFLTTPAGQLQSTDDDTPREFATELRLESGLNTLAFPAPSDRTLNETIDTDNVDTFYVYDNSEQMWLTPGDGTGATFNTSMKPGALDVFVVVVQDGKQATAVMEFENDFDGQANFDETDATVSTESWNLIGAANASNSSGTAFQGADVLVTTDDPYQDPNRQPFGVDSKNFSPYRGYWVYAEGESGGSDEVVSATFDGLTLQEYLESVNLDN